MQTYRLLAEVWMLASVKSETGSSDSHDDRSPESWRSVLRSTAKSSPLRYTYSTSSLQHTAYPYIIVAYTLLPPIMAPGTSQSGKPYTLVEEK